MGFAGRTRSANAWYISVDIRYDMSKYGSQYRGYLCRTWSQTWQEYRYQTLFYHEDGKERMYCECADWRKRELRCKHIIAVELVLLRYRGETAPEKDPPHPVGYYWGAIPH